MKGPKTILLMLGVASVIALPSVNAVDESWATKAPIPTPRVAAAVGVIDGQLYVVGGAPPSGFATTANEAYDPVTDSWLTKAPATIPRNQADASAINGKLYVVGGLINGEFPTNQLEVYDPVTDAWSTRAPDPSTRFNSGVAAIDGKLYVVGGVSNFSTPNLTTLEVYDPADDKWTIKAPMPTRREGLRAAAINGKLYAVGGFVRPENVWTGTLEVYDPVTNTWTTKASMPTPRAFFGVGVIDGLLHVVGGFNQSPTELSTHEVYDPVTDTWTTKAPMPTARGFLVAEAISSKLYAAGGYANCSPITGCETSDLLEVYSAETGCRGELLTAPASPLVGSPVCKPGFASPQCSAAAFDTSQDLAFVGNGFAQPAVARDVIPGFDSIHRPEFANDGYYGNGASWIGNSSGSWLKIDLGRYVTINRVNFGRDRLGGYDDRDPGQFSIAVAQSDNTYANEDDSNDVSEYSAVYNSGPCGFDGVIAGPQTLSVTFAPVVARFVKLTFNNVGAGIDEVQVFGSQSCFTRPLGMVAWWDGDTVSGTTAFDIAGANHGTMLGGVSIIPGISGSAFEFDGSSGRVEMGNPASLNFGTTGPFSLEAWFRWDGGGSSINNIIRKSNYPVSSPGAGYWLRIGQGSGILDFFAGETIGNQGLPQGLLSAPVTPAAWHHVVGTRDTDGTMRLYLDGELKGSTQAPNADTTSEAPFVLGAWDDRFGVIELFSGLIDEVSVYNRALSASEIQAIFAAGSLGKCKGPVNAPPTAVCKDVTVASGSDCSAFASIDDGSGDPDGDPILVSQSPAGPYAVGTTLVTLTVTDSHGASSSCSATVTVIDNTPPTMACPANIVIDNSSALGQCSAVVSYSVAATDNCSGVSATCSPASGSVFPQGTTSITCNATDSSGNSSSCSFTVTVIPPQLTSLGATEVWLGLKSSDDVGTQFDLLSEVFKNGTPVGSGQLNNVPGGSSGFNNAVLRAIELSLPAPVEFCPGDQLSFRLSVRIAATSGHRAGTARLWFNDSSANSRFGATVGGATQSYYLTSGSLLNPSPGSGPKNTIDVFVDRLAAGNPFKPFATWSRAL